MTFVFLSWEKSSDLDDKKKLKFEKSKNKIKNTKNVASPNKTNFKLKTQFFNFFDDFSKKIGLIFFFNLTFFVDFLYEEIQEAVCTLA